MICLLHVSYFVVVFSFCKLVDDSLTKFQTGACLSCFHMSCYYQQMTVFPESDVSQSINKKKAINAEQAECLEDLFSKLKWSFNWKKNDSKALEKGKAPGKHEETPRSH